MADFVGAFSTKTGYVSTPTSAPANSDGSTGGPQDPVDSGSTTESQPAQSALNIYELMMQGWEAFGEHAPLHAGFLKGFFIDGAKGDIDLAGNTADTLWNLRSPAQNAINFSNFTNKWIVPVVTASEEDIARVTETLQTPMPKSAIVQEYSTRAPVGTAARIGLRTLVVSIPGAQIFFIAMGTRRSWPMISIQRSTVVCRPLPEANRFPPNSGRLR